MSDNTPYAVRSFGSDCLGNITGYRVERYVWRPWKHSERSDGLGQFLDVAGQFCGNIYREGSFEKARAEADELCNSLNATINAA